LRWTGQQVLTSREPDGDQVANRAHRSWLRALRLPAGTPGWCCPMILGFPEQRSKKQRFFGSVYISCALRGYPETFQYCRASVKQPPGGNEIQGGRMARVCSASDGTLGKQIVRQHIPLAATSVHLENRVEDLPHVHLARATPACALLGGRDHRSHDRPLLVRHSRGIPLPRLAVFPHVRALLRGWETRQLSNKAAPVARPVSG
jgi:hypothetical protein